MGRIVIEIQAENSIYKAHRAFESLPIRIGRSYNNDLILNDPFISEGHLIIYEEDGQWMIEDLNSKNGTYFKKEAKVIDKSIIQSGDEFIIGKTKIKILNSSHVVPPTKTLIFRSPFIKKISQPINAFSITLILMISFIIEDHMNSIKNSEPVSLIYESMLVLFLIFIWAGFWGFVGRLIKKNSQFTAQLSLAAIYCFLLIPLSYFRSFLSYIISDLLLILIIDSVIYGVIFMGFLINNLSIATNISLMKRTVVSFLIVLLMTVLTILSYYTQKTEFKPYPQYNATLMPPSAKFVPSVTVDKFIQDSQSLFAKKSL